MSVVTSIMISCNFLDEADGEISLSPIDRVNEWLLKNTKSNLKKVDENFGGGNKCVQFALWAGGFNHFDEKIDEFAKFFQDLDWQFSNNALLIMYPEEGDSKVYRPL